ncbi:hypothetical protein Prudu_227S000600 [Prunus dulcis]|uniref:DUF4216 domain-containing protein n=1 Tax=Prunus dulcis TaxID=3755 RepID=A0A5H2XI43_PRUDU|nr:hypothetical protein Prudu_227S000600 [Prunus dulcis]
MDKKSSNYNTYPLSSVKCVNLKLFGVGIIRDHVYFNGIDQSYKNWTFHGEPWEATTNASRNVEEDDGHSRIIDTSRRFASRRKTIPTSMYEAKKTLCALGLSYEKMHACPNDCILYRKEYEDSTNCPTCGISRWKEGKDSILKEGVPAKVTAKSLTWHAARKSIDGQMSHPADSPSWKLLDDKWPEFGNEPRNLRLALSSDGFIPQFSKRQRELLMGKPEYGIPPEPLTGEEVLHMVENGDRVCWKKKSIFFDLEYWKYLPVRHALDVMHIEKNVPEGYSSNIKNLVSLQDSRLLGLKSHDCHTLMQQLLPVAIRSVLEKPARWMYPFERYMKVLKGYVQNRTRPKVALLSVGVPSSQKMGVSKPLSGCTVSVVDQDLLNQAHLYVLENTEEVLPYIEQHMIHIKTAYPKFRKRTKWLQDKHNSTFIQWLRFKVQSELEEDNHGVSENLRWLAAGPNMAVPLYRSYLIKGIKFNIKAQDDVRTTQNSGVYLLAHTMQVASAKDKNPILSNMGFYGVIQEIWDLDYQKFTIPVFRCDWIDSSGLVVDELGFTLVDLSKIGHRNDQFVLASQVKQIFFVDDPMHRGWSVVLSMPNREYNDVIGDEVLGDVIIECEPFTRGMPNVDTFDELVGELGGQNIRDGCEDIWIE